MCKGDAMKNRIEELRKEKGIRQEDFARLMGVSRQTISSLENGRYNPSILLADEPTGNLDPKNSWEIMHLLEEINRRGTTVVVVTHNREIVDAMDKRVITMHKGVILSDEKKEEHTYED